MELDEKAAYLRKLFVHRDDVFSLQMASGSYFKQEQKLSDRHLIDHLRGQHTLGCYQLKQEENGLSTVKWACLDIDLLPAVYRAESFDLADWEDKLNEQVEIAKLQLDPYHIPYYLEESGQKGKHIWIFFETPIDAVIVKKAMDSMFSKKAMQNVDEEAIDWEIFPKQTKLNHDYGSLVKLPFAVHQKTGKRSVFHTPLDEVKYTTEEQLNKTQNPYESIFQNCRALRNVRNVAMVTGHLSHAMRLDLAYIFWNLPTTVYDYDKHKGAKYLEERVFKHLSDYDINIIKKEFDFHKKEKTALDGTVKKGYSPATCKFLQSEGGMRVCSNQCQEIGESKSPIAFYYMATGQEMPHEPKAGGKDNNKIFKPDSYYVDGYQYCETGTVNSKGVQQPDTIISNFIAVWDKELTYDDGVEQTKIFEGNVFSKDVSGGKPVPIRISADKFSNDRDFKAVLTNTLGAKIYIENDRKLKEAMFNHIDTEKVDVLKIFGYNKDKTAYFTPSIKVTADGIFPNNDTLVHLEGEKAEVLDFCIVSNDDFADLKEHIKNDLLNLLEWHVTHTAFAHTMLPIIGCFLEDSMDINRYAYLIRGETGTGKSFLMKHMNHFYSPKFGPPISWTSTHNALQKIGFYFKDALFLVDDLKKRNIEKNYNGILGLLQNYADGTTRDRMKQDTGMQRSWPIRGWLAITGEDTVENEASNLARMITVKTSNKVKKMDLGAKVEEKCGIYSAFTARYVHYILNTNKTAIRDKFMHYRNNVFYPLVANKGNDARMSQNMAQMMTSYDYAMRFLSDDTEEYETNLKTMEEVLKNLVVSLVDEAGEESISKVVWDTLTDLLSRNKAYIQLGTTTDNNVQYFGKDMIGVRGPQDGRVYLLPSFYDTVQTYLKKIDKKMGHSKRAVIDELADKGYLESSKSVPRVINGNSQRVYLVASGELTT